MLPYARSWFDRWVESATEPGGFWSDQNPGAHFRTASTTGDALATLVAGLLDRHPDIVAVLDIGAGQGELLTGLAAIRPALDLTGVDLRARPGPLPEPVDWVRARWDVHDHRWTGPAADRLGSLDRPSLVIASEWLDDLPCAVAERVGGRWHQVLVDDIGRETIGEPVTGADLDWLEQWWRDGQRAEVGRTRDRAWTALVTTARSAAGMALLIDYGHLAGDRPAGGSLAAYRHGRRVAPRPSSRINLTAHVAVDAVRAAAEAQGARTLRCARQQEIVRDLPLSSSPGLGPLLDLTRRSQLAALGSPAGLGAHWWLLQH